MLDAIGDPQRVKDGSFHRKTVISSGEIIHTYIKQIYKEHNKMLIL